MNVLQCLTPFMNALLFCVEVTSSSLFLALLIILLPPLLEDEAFFVFLFWLPTNNGVVGRLTCCAWG